MAKTEIILGEVGGSIDLLNPDVTNGGASQTSSSSPATCAVTQIPKYVIAHASSTTNSAVFVIKPDENKAKGWFYYSGSFSVYDYDLTSTTSITVTSSQVSINAISMTGASTCRVWILCYY